MAWPRTVLHVDMDAFYASVEQLDQPSLRDRPVVVGYDGLRGVVCAASYEARKFGCRSAQPMSQAKRLCPQAVVVAPRFARYSEVSGRLLEILHTISPAVEPISIDEAFVDLTGTERLHGPAEPLAQTLKQRIRDQLGLTASIGMAPNKFLAKLASDLNKPDGLTIIAPDQIDQILPPLPVTRIWGVGPKTAAELARIGIHTIGDLRKWELGDLRRKFGDSGEHYHRLAHGLDKREVTPDSQAKSIGHEQTFGVDLIHLDEVRQTLLGQVEQVAARVRRHGRRAGCIVVKIRFGNFQTITRSRTFSEPTDQTTELWKAASGLLEEWAAKSFAPVRLIGVQATSFAEDEQQLSLFVDPGAEKRRQLDRAIDQINQRLGQRALFRGGAKR